MVDGRCYFELCTCLVIQQLYFIGYITTEHKCRALEGLHICVTNIDEATRSRISRQTAENGGTYCGELKKDSCTHLIVGLGKTAGSAKYKFAKQWGVNCVTLQVCVCHPD